MLAMIKFQSLERKAECPNSDLFLSLNQPTNDRPQEETPLPEDNRFRDRSMPTEREPSVEELQVDRDSIDTIPETEEDQQTTEMNKQATVVEKLTEINRQAESIKDAKPEAKLEEAKPEEAKPEKSKQEEVKKEEANQEKPKDILARDRKKIAKRLSKSNRKHNIMLIGPQGVGKTSLVNTFGAALTGRYRQIATAGGSQFREGFAGNTRAYTQYSNMGFTALNLNRIWRIVYFIFKLLGWDIQKEKVEKIKEELKMSEKLKFELPDFWDTMGMPEENNPAYTDVLKLCLYGILKNGADLYRLITVAGKYGLRGLEKIRPFKDVEGFQDRRITRVVIVIDATATETKSGFLQTVMDAAQPTDTENKLRLPVFVVVTKKDKLENIEDQKEKKEKLALFEKMIEEVKKITRISGQDSFYCEVKNYDKETANPKRGGGFYNNENLDCRASEALLKILNPKLRVDGLDDTPDDVRKRKAEIEREDALLDANEENSSHLFYYIVIPLVIAALAILTFYFLQR